MMLTIYSLKVTANLQHQQETRNARHLHGLYDSSAIGAGPDAQCIGKNLEQAKSVHVSTAAWQACKFFVICFKTTKTDGTLLCPWGTQ
jgi:hypothetical protein